MSRLNEIRSKLEYAERQRQSLMDTLFTAKKNSDAPEFICHTVADILSSSVECYDYCAKDIIEEKIIATTTNYKLKKTFTDGKSRAYFPFYRSQLENKKIYFMSLKIRTLLFTGICLTWLTIFKQMNQLLILHLNSQI